VNRNYCARWIRAADTVFEVEVGEALEVSPGGDEIEGLCSFQPGEGCLGLVRGQGEYCSGLGRDDLIDLRVFRVLLEETFKQRQGNGGVVADPCGIGSGNEGRFRLVDLESRLHIAG